MQDNRRRKKSQRSDVLKGVTAGLVGGLVASWTMNRFQDVWSLIAQGNEKTTGSRSLQQGSNAEARQQVQQASSEAQDDTTVRAASAVSEGFFGHELTKSEKKIAGPVVHYGLGTTVGGLYGAAAELVPEVTTGAGLPFGAVFWLVVDEGAVPLLGLSKGPSAYPVSTHIYALSSHFVYGLTAEVVRRALRNSM